MFRLASVAAAITLAIACGSTSRVDLKVHTSHDKTVSWSGMNSFRMASRTTAEASYDRYPRYESMAQEVLVEELTGRGYQLAEDGAVDFRVAFELAFRGNQRPASGSSPYGADAVPASAQGSGQTTTLIVRMLHPQTAQVLWEGTLSGFSVGTVKPEADLRTVVRRLLAEFPPLGG